MADLHVEGLSAAPVSLPSAFPLELDRALDAASDTLWDSAPVAPSQPTRTTWTPDEDAIIVTSVHELGLKWRKIAARLPGRSDDSVRNRWNRLEEGRKTSDVLMEAGGPGYKCAKCGLRKKGHSCMALMTGGEAGALPMPVLPSRPRAPGSKTGQDASTPAPQDWRDDVSLKKRTGWSPEEDALIVRKVEELGQRWLQISSFLEDRTDHAVRNRWHRLQRRIREADKDFLQEVHTDLLLAQSC